MNQSFIIGQYVPKESPVHALNARTKLVIVFFYVLVTFSAETLSSYLILFLFAAFGAVMSRVHPLFIVKGLRPIWFIIILTFILHLFIQRQGEVLFSIFGYAIYDQAVIQAAIISSRLFLLILMTSLLTLTTTPISITDAVETLLKPLKSIKLPIHELALMMSISLRFIPTLIEETDKISKAQASRGIDFRTGKWRDRLKAIFALLIPLFISAFKRAEDLAMAMEARGYRGDYGRTKFRELKFTSLDLIVFLLFIIIVIGFFYFNG